jgi:uncharacterized membrane protein YphA (DoxX/SURF4 family)
LRDPKVTLDAAQTAMTTLQSLPDPVGSKIPSDPETVARINAAVQVGGGLLLATGKLPRIASAALAFTVIPGSLGGHLFWNEPDPEVKVQKRRDLLTDLSLLGGLIIASADTAGKPSLGWRGRRAASRLSEKVSAALPLDSSDDSVLDSELAERIAHGLHVGAERGRELASTAAERSAPVVEAARKRARKRGAELAETVRERGAELADTARERGSELAETARERGSEFGERAIERGSELADTARERGVELAETARERGGELAARGRVKARRWR